MLELCLLPSCHKLGTQSRPNGLMGTGMALCSQGYFPLSISWNVHALFWEAIHLASQICYWIQLTTTLKNAWNSCSSLKFTFFKWFSSTKTPPPSLSWFTMTLGIVCMRISNHWMPRIISAFPNSRLKKSSNIILLCISQQPPFPTFNPPFNRGTGFQGYIRLTALYYENSCLCHHSLGYKIMRGLQIHHNHHLMTTDFPNNFIVFGLVNPMTNFKESRWDFR